MLFSSVPLLALWQSTTLRALIEIWAGRMNLEFQYGSSFPIADARLSLVNLVLYYWYMCRYCRSWIGTRAETMDCQTNP